MRPKWLLTDIIKQEYGFKGFFISDMGDVENLATSLHQIAENQKEAVCKSVNAGLDMHMYSADSARFVKSARRVSQGKKVSSRRIDDAVRRILKIKFSWDCLRSVMYLLKKIVMVAKRTKH